VYRDEILLTLHRSTHPDPALILAEVKAVGSRCHPAIAHDLDIADLGFEHRAGAGLARSLRLLVPSSQYGTRFFSTTTVLIGATRGRCARARNAPWFVPRPACVARLLQCEHIFAAQARALLQPVLTAVVGIENSAPLAVIDQGDVTVLGSFWSATIAVT